MNDVTDLLIIFTRNPELGKCKTRLASKIGNQPALDIYRFLLDHTVNITEQLNVKKQVYYSEEIWLKDIWNEQRYEKKLQVGTHLGERMKNAFTNGFAHGYERIIIIGSDMYDLSSEDIKNAFNILKKYNFVIGPAEDGGYYLLGMQQLKADLFIEKDWGQTTVLDDTLKNLVGENYALLETRNDVDHYEDIEDVDAFQPFIKHMK